MTKKPDLSDPVLRAKLAKGMGHNYYGEPAWPNDLLYIFPVVILGTIACCVGLAVMEPTPLGEPADLTVRAIAALAAADVVACEDTRVAGLLYEAAGIKRKAAFVRHDAATAAATAPRLVEAMRRGETVALVSDAGTPAVSDPGALLVRAARDAGLAVRALPGPCAATTALSASGFGNGLAFSFLGFVEGRGASAARRRALRSALDAAVEGPAVLYESPRRVRQTLLDLDKLDGGASQRLVLIARELTKTHEETWRGALGDAVAYLDAGGGGLGTRPQEVGGVQAGPRRRRGVDNTTIRRKGTFCALSSCGGLWRAVRGGLAGGT